MNKRKIILTSVVGAGILFSLSACSKPVDKENTENNNTNVTDTVPEKVPEAVPETTPETQVENIEEEVVETEEEVSNELVFSMTDNRPVAMEKIEAAREMISILEKGLTNTLSQPLYEFSFSEVFDSNSLNNNRKFNYRAIDITKDEDKIYFDAMNEGKFYKGEANQTFGIPATNLSAKNLITSRVIEALDELGLSNGLNDIYSLFTNVINLDDSSFEEIFKEHPETISVTYSNLQDGSTQYNLSIINPLSFISTDESTSAASYVSKSSRTYVENAQFVLSFVIDNNNLIKNINVKDNYSAGYYNQTYLGRYISFSYGENTYNIDNTAGAGELPVTVGALGKELNMGRTPKSINPLTSETAGGIDNTRWQITYKRMPDGINKAVQLTAATDSNYNVNGITKGMNISQIISKMDSVIYQDSTSVIGLKKSGENVFTISVFLDEAGLSSSITVKLNPLSDMMNRMLNVGDVGSYIKNISENENTDYFNNNKMSIINSMFKMLAENFELNQTVEISGQNLKKYEGKIYGTNIKPDTNYIYSEITGDMSVSESTTIKKVGEFSSHAAVLNVFIQNCPTVAFSSLTKVENSDGTISYSGNIDVGDNSYADLVKLAYGYPGINIDSIVSDVSAAPAPDSMYIDILEKDGLIRNLIIRLESKRDTVTYTATIEYK